MLFPIQIPQRTGYGMSRLTTDSIIRQVYSGTRYLPKILSLRSRNITKENERLMRTRQRLKQRTKRSAKEPDFYVADPAIAQRSAHGGTSIQTEYAMRGLPFALGSNNVETGVAKVQSYLRNIPGTDTPRRVITENCEAFISEMRKLRWKTTQVKRCSLTIIRRKKSIKDDHLCDSDRYFHTFLPDLALLLRPL